MSRSFCSGFALNDNKNNSQFRGPWLCSVHDIKDRKNIAKNITDIIFKWPLNSIEGM